MQPLFHFGNCNSHAHSLSIIPSLPPSLPPSPTSLSLSPLQVGISVQHHKLPTDITESSLLATIQRLNFDPTVHGILLQLPLDCVGEIDADKCTNAIAVEKVVLCVAPLYIVDDV